ncbi:hypothetical protein BKA81DRAFT_374887 [Phyllosticta paracitricarpa]|uniref:Uncharacterized protein n=1 Tax=Phyllosticta paracitricarpa TaxID=2016321 RepID=A0ABR1NGE8_9PEZI
MFPQTPYSSSSKPRASMGSRELKAPHLSRSKPAQLPTPPHTQARAPSRLQFPFTPELVPLPGRCAHKQHERPQFFDAVEEQDPSDSEKGYGSKDSEEFVEENTSPNIFSNRSAPKPRRLVSKAHFEKVSLETPQDASAESDSPNWTSGIENQTAPLSRPTATPRRHRRAAHESPLLLSQTHCGRSTRATASATNGQRFQHNATSSKAPDANKSAEHEFSHLLHSWSWPVVHRHGNFEECCGSANASPARIKEDRKSEGRRGADVRTEIPVGRMEPPLFASPSLAQMKAMTTVTPPEVTAQTQTPPMTPRKWRPPRFARREDDLLPNRELAQMLGRLGFAAEKGKGKRVER